MLVTNNASKQSYCKTVFSFSFSSFNLETPKSYDLIFMTKEENEFLGDGSLILSYLLIVAMGVNSTYQPSDTDSNFRLNKIKMYYQPQTRSSLQIDKAPISINTFIYLINTG